jgi:two-component system response regulator AtoC
MTGSESESVPPPRARDGAFSEPYLRQYAPLFANSPRMQMIRRVIEEVANTSAAVLIRGESGVGKEVVARAIHAASPRHAEPFVKVNCAALPAELLESELFGHEKGAFTGAYRRKMGKFEYANKGTIFLDEIGDLPRALQAKLLHVLQDYEFSRIGGRELIRVDTRVIAATNRNLEAALESGDFREDLYYRLNVVEIHVPPLRERRDEIPVLAAMLLERFNREYHRTISLSPATLAIFQRYSWPGNIRELDNVVRRLVLLDNPRQVHEELANSLRAAGRQPVPGAAPSAEPAGPNLVADLALGLKEIARRAALEAERKALAEVLDRVHWNRTEAARILRVSYKTLLTKIAECGLTRDRTRSEGL